MASTADLFTSTENGGPPVPTTASATRVIGATTLEAEALDQWPTVTKVHFATGEATTDAEGNPIINQSTLCLWSGIGSGSQLNDLVLRYSATGSDPGNNIGDLIQMVPSSSWAYDLFLGLTEDHDTEGHHETLHDTNGNVILGLSPTSSAVNELQISNATTGNAPTLSATGSDPNISLNIAPKGTGKVESNGNALWQYLGLTTYAGGNQATTSTSFVAMTGMTVPTTVPANASLIRITVNAQLTNSVSGDAVAIAVYKDGIYLAQRWFHVPGNNYFAAGFFTFYDTSPSSGSHTYAMYFAASGGTATFQNGGANSTPFTSYSATVLAECI